MLKFLLASSAIVTVLILSQPARSAVIADLGVNPTSAQGEFSNSVGGGAFEDQFTFQLVGGPQFVAIGSATNVFASPPDFITSFTGQLFSQVGVPGGGDDIPVDVPFAAIGCPTSPTNCQLVAGIALLDPGQLLPRIRRHRRRHLRLWRQPVNLRRTWTTCGRHSCHPGVRQPTWLAALESLPSSSSGA